jgi:valyl-tRNA synthetase
MTATEPRTAPDLPKGYEPGQVEQRLYQFWEEGGYFKPRRDPTKTPFVISIPPPNVTGVLHMGHMLTVTMEDIMIRYHRMRGDPTLWVPGEDHAGIATQTVVEKHIAEEKTDRHKLGREKFIERVWEWVAIYKTRIQEQTRRFGASVDWDRERFTLDDGLAQAVREVFVQLYEEDLIYRGERIINWCPRCMSAISDLEVINQDTPGKLTWISYPMEPQEGDPPEGLQIVVATTRPETMLGDTAIAVHPADGRYQALIGRNAILPLMGRLIPIIADTSVEMSFGSGAVKVTPAHDPTDFEIGQRHDLPQIQVIGFDAKMTEHAGKYAGLDRFEARARILADLETAGRLIRQEDYTIPIGHCERCDTIIEPLISKQWFVKMMPLATPALNALKYGQLRIVPERFDKIYTDWLTNIRDWNISRQLWWGHRIPAWYCANCSATTVSRTDPTECPTCGSAELTQDPDVLDTWFSSWLWPFSTLGWPEKTDDLLTFYPTAVLETGYDIIFFWVARMVMAGIHFMGKPPFHTIYLHGLIRDERGRKVSKTLKNGLDPVLTINKFGADALRFTLATSSTPGNDIKLFESRIEGNRNFANKIWNAGRLVLMQTTDFAGPLQPLESIKPRTLADTWILSRAQRLTREVTALFDEYQFGEAGRAIYDFFWSEFCDWYLEIAKTQMAGEGATPARTTTAAILRGVLDRALRLLHPFMPFVTEEVWQYLIGAYEQAAPAPTADPRTPPASADGERAGEWGRQPMRPALIVAPWPEAAPAQQNERAEADFEVLRAIITRIRDARQQAGVEPGKRIAATLVGGPRTKLLKEQAALFEQFARVQAPEILTKLAKKPAQAVTLLVEGIEIYLPLEGMVDLAKERTRLEDAITKAEADAERVRGKLSNEQFVARAKPEIVQTERDRLAAFEDDLKKLRARRAELGQ